MLKKFDRWLIDSVYQRIVDYTQKSPAWLARQCVIAMLVVLCLRTVIREDLLTNWVLILLSVLICSLLFASTLPEDLFRQSFGGWFIFRMLWLICVALDVAVLIASLANTDALIRLVRSLLDLSFLYFAACSTPRPRVRRQTTTRPALGF